MMQTQPKRKNKPIYTWVKPHDKKRAEKVAYPAHISKNRKLELLAAGQRFGFIGAIASTKKALYVFNRKGYVVATLEGKTLETAKRHFKRYFDTHAVV